MYWGDGPEEAELEVTVTFSYIYGSMILGWDQPQVSSQPVIDFVDTSDTFGDAYFQADPLFARAWGEAKVYFTFPIFDITTFRGVLYAYVDSMHGARVILAVTSYPTPLGAYKDLALVTSRQVV